MAYCTLDDLKLRISSEMLLRLSQDDSASVDINTDNIDAAIDDAASIIDNKLHRRYELPFEEAPEILTRISVDISIYQLYKRRTEGTMPEQIETSYKEAISYLNDLRDGVEALKDVEFNEDNELVIATNQHLRDRNYTNRKLRRI